jgi:porin
MFPRRARLVPAAILSSGLVVWPLLLHAQSSGPSPAAATDSQPAPAAPGPADAPQLSAGDPLAVIDAELKRLKKAGFKLGLQEQSEVWANVAGGGKQGTSYNGLTTAKLDVDLDKAFGWQNAEFFVNVFDIHGHGPTRSLVGNQQIVSNIEASPSIKLYDLWLEQGLFNQRLMIRVGQEGANDEMMVTQYGAMFLNSSFGFPGMPAAVLPSGGPNYPMATPFARAIFKANAQLSLVAAAYNGDPAPPGSGDPQLRDRNGTAFRLNDHTLMFSELQFSPAPQVSDTLPTTYKLGAWYASNHFADQRFDTLGGLLASPASIGGPRQHTGDWAFYGIVDQVVWHPEGAKDQGVGVFLQVMAGPADRNLSNLFIEGGLNWRAPFAQRTDDVFGLAFAYLGISPAAREYSQDLVAFGSAVSPYRSDETVVEITYLAPITSRLTLQPDVQIVVNPGAGVPGPFGRTPLADAVVIGMRATFKF